MIIAVLANNILPALGTIYIVTCVWKIARSYKMSRWFF